MIRKATPQDFDAILDLSAEFWLHTQFTEPFERDHTLVMVQMAYDHELLAVVDVDGKVMGFSAGIKAPLLGSSQAMHGTELAWWISPQLRGKMHGVRLLEFIERLAIAQDLTYWHMVSMESSMPEYVNGLYERLGYKKSETTWTKVLKNGGNHNHGSDGGSNCL